MIEEKFDEKAYVEDLLGRVDSLTGPSDESFFNYVFVPYCRFPEVHAFKIYVNDTVKPFSSISDVSGSFYEIFLCWDAPWEVCISIGGVNFLLWSDSDLKRMHLSINGVTVAGIPKSDLLTFSMRSIRGKKYVSLNGRKIIEVEIGFEGALGDVAISCQKGEAGIIQAQTIGRHGMVEYVDYFNCDPRRKVMVDKSSPKWVLRWEKQTRCIYQTAVMSFIALEEMEYLRGGSDWSNVAREKIYCFLNLYFEILLSWDFWRPSESPSIGNGEWERNNWSNGFAPGAFAVIATVLGKNDEHFVKEKLIKCGLSWLNYMRDVAGPLQRRFPDSRHWVSRSTNHGIVIYASFLFGVELSGLKHPSIKCLRDELYKTLSLSLEDGCYVEGLSYLQFIFLEMTPLIWLYFSRQDKAYDEFLPCEFPFFNKVPLFLYYATGKGRPMAKFGDCRVKEWLCTPLKTIGSFSHNVDLSPLDEFCSHPNSRGNEYFPLSLSLLNSNVRRDRGGKRPLGGEYQLFSTAQMVGLKFYEKNNIWSVWVNGSKVHRTHNRDHDLASFFIYCDDKPWVTENPGRGAWHHNSWLLKGKALEDASDDFSSYGDVSKSGELLTRSNSGVISLQEGGDNHLRFYVKAKKMFSIAGKETINSAERCFVFPLEGSFYFLVFDCVNASHDNDIRGQFIFGESPGIDGDCVNFSRFGDLLLVGSEGGPLRGDAMILKDGYRLIHKPSYLVGDNSFFARGFFSKECGMSYEEKKCLIDKELSFFKERFFESSF